MAQGVPGRLRPRIFLTFRQYNGGRSSAKRTGRLYPRRNPWYSLSEAESTSGHMVLSGVPRKKSPVTPSGIDPGTSTKLCGVIKQGENLNFNWESGGRSKMHMRDKRNAYRIFVGEAEESNTKTMA